MRQAQGGTRCSLVAIALAKPGQRVGIVRLCRLIAAPSAISLGIVFEEADLPEKSVLSSSPK